MPQAKRTKSESKKFTYADYCTWPEETRCELIDGVVFDMTPAPSRLHSTISGSLFNQLYNFFLGKQCQVYNAPFDVRLPRNKEPDDEVETVVQPDRAYSGTVYRSRRRAVTCAQDSDAWLRTPHAPLVS